MLKATANDRRHLALCHDEFRGPRSGLCRSGQMCKTGHFKCDKSNLCIPFGWVCDGEIDCATTKINDTSDEDYVKLSLRLGGRGSRVVWVSDRGLLCHGSLAEIVEVEIEVVSPSIVPSGSFSELKSHCHLYGAQGQRQAYLLPMPR
ncbi:hypothetical protein TNCV_128541 [Trichonephila clavipes]|nr:hypothetical protein TNCV_128541 [Trichonephila clavipes]